MTFSPRGKPVKIPINKMRGQGITVYGAIGEKLPKFVYSMGYSTNSNGLLDFLKLLRSSMPRNLRNKKIVLVLDNHRAHKTNDVKALCEELNIQLMFLPPYRPQLNPIEALWSVVKHYFKRVLRDRHDFKISQEEFETLLATQLSKVTPEQQAKAAKTNHRNYMHQVLSGEILPVVFPYGNYEGDVDSVPIQTPAPSNSDSNSESFQHDSYGSSGPAELSIHQRGHLTPFYRSPASSFMA